LGDYLNLSVSVFVCLFIVFFFLFVVFYRFLCGLWDKKGKIVALWGLHVRILLFRWTPKKRLETAQAGLQNIR